MLLDISADMNKNQKTTPVLYKGLLRNLYCGDPEILFSKNLIIAE